jgi:hypothetical protein
MDLPAVLFFDPAGRVVALTPNAGCYLRELGACDRRWLEGEALPLPVQVILAALPHTSNPSAPAVPRARIRALSGGWLNVFGALTEVTPGHPAERVVIITSGDHHDDWWRTLLTGDVARLHDAIDNGCAMGQAVIQTEW